MRRRRFLAVLGGSASLGLGGLLSYRASRTRTLSVTSVETYDAAFRLDQHRYRKRENESTDSLDRAEAGAVESAIDGGYETDDPPSWLTEFRDRVEFVRHEGASYRLSDNFPAIVVTAEPYGGDPADLSVAEHERFHEAIGRHSDVDGDAFLARAQLDGVVDRDPERPLREFFETFDAARVGGRLYQFTVTYRDPDPPYRMTAERVSAGTVREARMVDLADVAQPARDRFRRAIDAVEGDERGRSIHGLVDPAPELLTRLRATGLLRADGKVYDVQAWSFDHLSLSVTATATESDVGFKDPGRIAFAVENAGDRPVSVHGGAPRPFGTLRYRPTDGGDTRYLYSLTERRSSSMWPTTSGHHVDGDELESGQGRTVEYALGGDAVGVPPGEYVVESTLRIGGGHRGGAFPFRVGIEIE